MESLTLLQAGDLIRKVWRRGRKTVEINGVKYNIRRQDKPVVFTSGGVSHKRTESWLVCKRVDGALVPTYSVEMVKDGNLRSKTS